MLTRNDLSQIRKIFQGETRKTVREETPGIVRKIVQEETPGIVRKIVQEETPGIVRKIVQEELKPVKSDVQKIQKDINLIVRTFDRDYVGLRRRVEHIEDHLKLPPVTS